MMRRPFFALILLELSACASSGARPAVSGAEESYGLYDFVAPFEGLSVRGQMQIAPDSVLVAVERSPCRGDPSPTNATALLFGCDPTGPLTQILVRVDRSSPLRRSTMSALRVAMRTERTCALQPGSTRCVPTTIERPQNVSVSATLVATRSGDAPARKAVVVAPIGPR